MRFHLLGSAAGKTIPRPFCRCRVCLHALSVGGPDYRTRTGMNLFTGDEEGPEPRYRIDLPPDTGHHMVTYGFNMNQLEHLLFTHPDEDHFDLTYLRHRGRLMSDRAEMLPLNIYGSKETAEAFAERGLNMEDLRLEFHEVEPFTQFRAGELEVFTLLGNHRTGTLHYVVHYGGQSVLLAWDTGWYKDETWAALKSESFRLDAVFMECTQFSAEETIRHNSHCNFYTTRMMREKLIEMDAITSSTPFTTLHMGDNGRLLHSERLELAEPHGITVGYDGLELTI